MVYDTSRLLCQSSAIAGMVPCSVVLVVRLGSAGYTRRDDCDVVRCLPWRELAGIHPQSFSELGSLRRDLFSFFASNLELGGDTGPDEPQCLFDDAWVCCLCLLGEITFERVEVFSDARRVFARGDC